MAGLTGRNIPHLSSVPDDLSRAVTCGITQQRSFLQVGRAETSQMQTLAAVGALLADERM